MAKLVIVFLLSILFMTSASGCSGSSGKIAQGDGTVIPAASFRETGRLYVSAWYGNFDLNRGMKSFSQNLQLIDEINPVWHNLNPVYLNPGAVPFINYNASQTQIFPLSRSGGVKVIPTIQNWGDNSFDPAVIGAIVRDPNLRSKHVREILDLVLNQSYDGIDIDYENMYPGDRDSFSAFITELASALHRNRKILSVTVHPKTNINNTWQGPGAQDWVALAGVADLIKVMVYDYHWIGFHAGPVAPNDWLRAVLNYAGTVPGLRGKLIIGLPLYGYDWGDNNISQSLVFEEAVNRATFNNALNYNRDSLPHYSSYCQGFWENVEPHFEYWAAGVRHQVYYQDSLAIKKRLDLILNFPDLIKGIAFWRLGGEDPGTWDQIEKWK